MKNKFLFATSFAMALFLFLFPACDVTSEGEEHTEVEGFVVNQNGKEIVRYFNGSIQNNGTLNATKGLTTDDFSIQWLNDSGAVITDVEEGSSLHVKSANTALVDVVTTGAWTFKLKGISAGTSSVEIGLLHSGHFDFEKRPVPVSITSGI